MEKDETEIKLRNYQAELFQKIKNQNAILFLPTGSGKTLIAVWLIKYLAKELQKSISEGGKRTYFLVNTVELVEQQTKYIKTLCSLKVRDLAGNQGTDFWKKKEWDEIQEENQIIVMTSQIYLNALIHGYLLLKNANLLIFDECHHAVNNHPMREIMKRFEEDKNKCPQILGMSATLLNANSTEKNVQKKLLELETTFKAKILTSRLYEELHRYSAKPEEFIVQLDKYELNNDIKEYFEKWQNNIKIIDFIKLKEDEIIDSVKSSKHFSENILTCSDYLFVIPGINRSKLLKNTIKDIQVHIKEFGLYFGYICAKCYIIQLYRFLYISSEPVYVTLILYVINLVQLIRKFLFSEISKYHNIESLAAIENTSTSKFKYLRKILKNLKPDDKCIIFVERKMTAKTLYNIICLYKKLEQEASHINVDFVIGSDSNPLRNTKEGLYDNKYRRHILKAFKKGLVNVLIATNILEEGINVQDCNIILMFDELKTFRSYVQSKGRARKNESKYIILNDLAQDKFESRINRFRKIENDLDMLIDEKDIMKEEDESETVDNEYYSTKLGANISPANSIALIYRYCNSLPQDIFTQLVPYWWITEKTGKKVCKLQLPVNSAIRTVIVGPECLNSKSAKQGVAFKTVKLLHEQGELNDYLLPVQALFKQEINSKWLPNWEPDSTSNVDITKENVYTTSIKIPKFLKNCCPVSNSTSYIHVIKIKTAYKKPEINRKLYCHGLLASNYEFGIITRQSLPDICEFPIYTDLGKIIVKIKCNVKIITLNEEEIESIEKFHKFLFLNILQVVRECFLYQRNEDNYFIVPLKPEKDEQVNLAWGVIRKKVETSVIKPSNLERKTKEYNEKNYLGKVITPWYCEKPSNYIVTNLNTDLNLQSRMCDKNITFEKYFKEKYDLTALRPLQPMMEVRTISKVLESIKPRRVTASEKLKNRQNKDFQTYMAPEFCVTQIFPSVFWYKSVILPSVLHRFYHLLLAEDLRHRVVKETSLGNLNSSNNKESNYFPETKTQRILQNVQLHPVKYVSKMRRTKNINDNKLVKDIYHEIEITQENIKQFVDYIDMPLPNNDIITVQCDLSNSSKLISQKKTDTFQINFVDSPNLLLLNDLFDNGPDQYHILQALTLKGSDDLIDLERLETLGDSFLKYAVSFVIFIKENKMNEGLLTQLKGEIIGNKNLYYCGRKLGIPSYIKKLKFSVKNSWYPPGFSIPKYLKDNLLNITSPSSLMYVKLPYHEQFSGDISLDTIENIQQDFEKHLKNKNSPNITDEITGFFYLNMQELKHKSISDVVEALIGVYLQHCGIKGAFSLLKYFGIIPYGNFDDFITHKLPSPACCNSIDKVEFLIPDYKKLEKLLNYRFNDKNYILQALTHPSCITNTLTDCYQKLEFIGDALLDFLITSYIYEYYENLSPGQITDLRSALVNNNTFGAFAVRLGLHKYMLSHCKPLQDAIENFLLYQEEKNYKIHGNELMILINDKDTQIAEEVDVPKALGDIFESIAGAIFLDSKYNLKTVWHIYYNIMKEEIGKFGEQVPVNPVRALYERNLNIKFYTIKNNENLTENKTKVQLNVILKKKTISFIGRGLNVTSAKRAAAKIALKKMGYSDFVI